MFTLLALHAFARSPLAQGCSKWVGNIIPGSVPSNWDKYWNQVTSENGCKWGTVQSSQSSFNWNECDVAYNHAKTAGIPFKYHTFVWGSQEPGFINSLSGDAAKTAVESLISAAKAKYSPDFIDVVNEALHAPSSIRSGLGGDGSTGWDWVVWSFKTARAAFGSAKLLINDYGIINDASAVTRYLTIINALKSAGYIDGIGIQCHQFNVNDLSAATITSNLNSLAATSLPIYVSELDINGNSEQDQSSIYQRVFPALFEHSGVKGITLWGYISGSTWKDGTGIVESGGQERAAIKWLAEYLESHC
uniref:Putative glycosyl hydrolase family10 n=1 Tax=uncultured symbiotic protist of Hodotermopsis sjoestedti TaxID=403659 RepID=A4UWT5_9EUKA|nr:putative glycosyl hydrolase family10 [uncultured symbiotic protist of Hodotermopsis sjoestedti]